MSGPWGHWSHSAFSGATFSGSPFLPTAQDPISTPTQSCQSLRKAQTPATLDGPQMCACSHVPSPVSVPICCCWMYPDTSALLALPGAVSRPHYRTQLCSTWSGPERLCPLERVLAARGLAWLPVPRPLGSSQPLLHPDTTFFLYLSCISQR